MTAQQAQLIAKLQEIFQINQPDLDFGIYRILNSRQEQINEFLQKTLPTKINTAFNGNFEQANSVYNHLYTFFSRYYDQGDFISQRRYKGDTYAIPYAGEEVMLHWANKDQYYTKSGENFSNYAFTLENGNKVQFRLVEADTAKDNRKDNDQVRVFSLIEPRIKIEIDENGDETQTDIIPIEQNGDLLTIRFEYIAIKGTEQQRKKLQKEYILQAVEKIKNFAISDEFQSIFTLKPTDGNKTRTLLEKYLTDYTEKNTADYFIHKNLGKFLNQELDFYIKNEVMNLDNIQDSTDFSHIEQNLQTIKTLKAIGKEIIAFLAQLEDFQKKLWLKKKFVTGCHYLMTLDHLTEEQVKTALNNPKQTAQWKALFNIETSGQNAAEICKNYPHLVVDTALFEPTFQAEVLNTLNDLDEKTNGLLIHSDNFQALNLLQERYKEQVKCIYIDPPYNTNSSEIVYKNNYKHSSWLSLMESRVELSKNLQKDASFIFVAIDDLELFKLNEMLEGIYSKDNFIANISLIHKPEGRNQEKFFGTSNEFMLVYSNNKAKADFYQVILDPEKKLEFDLVDNSGAYKRKNFIRLSDGKYALREAKPDFYYPIYVSQDLKSISVEPIENATAVYPITDLGVERTWKTKPDTFINYFNEGNIEVINENGNLTIYEKLRENQVIKTHWSRKEYHAYHFGTKYLENILGTKEFSFPKSIHTVIDTLKLSTANNDLVLDYFGGSGTTAHAVINLNRDDQGERKYILVEQGEYFDTVLKPRVQKVIFAKEWKDGKPCKIDGDNGRVGVSPRNGDGNSEESGSIDDVGLRPPYDSLYGGVSQIVKVLKLESYEDTLNNLELIQPASDLFAQNETLKNDYLLHYMLDIESRDSLLNTKHFAKPFDYKLNIATSSAGAYEAKSIDLVETFNYLIGLRVSEINDKRENGLVTVQGTNASGEKVLIIWRDCEKYDYDKLGRYLDSRDINPQDSEFDVVYINGDHNVATAWEDLDGSVKTLKVRSIESEFLSRMFGDK